MQEKAKQSAEIVLSHWIGKVSWDELLKIENDAYNYFLKEFQNEENQQNKS